MIIFLVYLIKLNKLKLIFSIFIFIFTIYLYACAHTHVCRGLWVWGLGPLIPPCKLQRLNSGTASAFIGWALSMVLCFVFSGVRRALTVCGPRSPAERPSRYKYMLFSCTPGPTAAAGSFLGKQMSGFNPHMPTLRLNNVCWASDEHWCLGRTG